MRIDPEAQAVLDDMAAASKRMPDPSSEKDKLVQARRQTNALVRFSDPMPDVTVETREIEGRHGPIPIEIYRPGDAEGTMVVWFHGGGAIAGSIETHRAPLAALAVALRRPVASVGYRLAPESQFPVQHEDCFDALRALAENGAPLVVGGDSIGGLFATTAARLARDADGPPVAAQILLYPNTDMRQNRDFASITENAGYVMTPDSLRFEADNYIPGTADRESALASPLLAPDLAGLPKTLLVTCEADPLRDEGLAYAARLREAGVAVTERRFPGMIHAFLQTGAVTVRQTGELRGAIRDFLGGLPR